MIRESLNFEKFQTPDVGIRYACLHIREEAEASAYYMVLGRRGGIHMCSGAGAAMVAASPVAH